MKRPLPCATLLGLFAVSSCAGHAPRETSSSRSTLSPDIAELGRLWRGDRAGCTPADAHMMRGAPAGSAGWTCVVAGWESVLVTEEAARRMVYARAGTWQACQLERLAHDREVTQSMEGQIVTEVTAALRSDLFAGNCALASFWYDRPGCSVAIFTPTKKLPPRPVSDPARRRGLCDAR